MSLSEQNSSIELSEMPSIEQVKSFEAEQPYQPLLGNRADAEDAEDTYSEGDNGEQQEAPFSRVAYAIFLLLGVAMLWSTNMFLAAAPYFQSRFDGDKWIMNHFQSSEISVEKTTTLVALLTFSLLQKNASYPKRIIVSLIANIILYTILALSTFVETTQSGYFSFLLVMIFVISLSSASIQNGTFSYAVGFGRREYAQAIMVGFAVAGVVPPTAQIISVLLVPAKHHSHGAGQSSKSAFVYFMTATAVSGISLLAFFELLRRKSRDDVSQSTGEQGRQGIVDGRNMTDSEIERKQVSLIRLTMRIPYLVLAVIICFSLTFFAFPVFSSVIHSVSGIDNKIFVPLAFLIWNVGDLLGRLATGWRKIQLTHYPFALFCLSMARFIFIPMYFLCNIKSRGAVIHSDFFYLVIVQLLFGFTNGYIGSNCMMAGGDWVSPEEREVVGGFMAMLMVAGLTIGSLLSFTLGDI